MFPCDSGTENSWPKLKKQEKKHRYQTGEIFLYSGREYRLRIVPDLYAKRPVFKLEENELQVFTCRQEPEILSAAVLDWYRGQARRVFGERVEHYRTIMGITVGQIRIKDQKRRWGSCSSKGNLNFNWRLVMAPLPVLDYVVVHELCHFRQMNHSRAFWQEVKQMMPDYLVYQMWLKDHGSVLLLS